MNMYRFPNAANHELISITQWLFSANHEHISISQCLFSFNHERVSITYIFLFAVREGIKGIFDRGLNENPQMVVNAIIDAVSSRDPKPRYLVGPVAKFIAFTCIMPTWLQDIMLSFV